MRYTVASRPSADDELVKIWMQASDRPAVTAAADEIEQLLKHWPTSVGEPYGSRRQLTIDPVMAVYEVSPDDRMVIILEYHNTA